MSTHYPLTGPPYVYCADCGMPCQGSSCTCCQAAVRAQASLEFPPPDPAVPLEPAFPHNEAGTESPDVRFVTDSDSASGEETHG